MTLFRNQKKRHKPKIVTRVTKICHTARAARRKNAKSAVSVIFLCTTTLRFWQILGIWANSRPSTVYDLLQLCHKNDISRFVTCVTKNDTSRCVTCVTKTTQVAVWHVHTHSFARSARNVFRPMSQLWHFFDMSQKRHKSFLNSVTRIINFPKFCDAIQSQNYWH